MQRLLLYSWIAAPLLCGALLIGCAASSRWSVSAGMGPNPTLPAPQRSLVPVVNPATAVGWAQGEAPTAAPGLAVQRFAADLRHPRWLHVLPNGDVLVAETNAPPRDEDNRGIKGWFVKRIMRRAGATEPSADRITLLRDADGDGVAEIREVFLERLNSPFGMALIGQRFYVANTDGIMRYPYSTGALRIDAAGEPLASLPAGRRNHHWTKSLIASADGKRLYAGVGSNSNVAEHGLQQERGRAAIWEIDAISGAARVFATGLRNPVGLAWVPTSGTLWTVVNERDELGHDLVPDYLTSVREYGFYGWPCSYFGAHRDVRAASQCPRQLPEALVPDYALGAHTASLGLAWYQAGALPASFGTGMFVGQHGSWNRRPRSGYRVIFIPFTDGRPSGDAREVLSGFLRERDQAARGRPVGVAIDGRGALLVADDVGNIIWRVSAVR